MPVEGFQISDVSVLKLVQCTSVPKVMIIAGPNGVGKSTLLEEITNSLRGKAKVNAIVGTSNSPKPVYFPPHRTPSVVSLHKSLPILGPRRKYRDALGLQNFSIGSPYRSDLPHYVESGIVRTRLNPDFSPHIEMKYRLTQFEQEFKDTLAELYRENRKVLQDSMPNIYKPFKDAVKQLLPGLEFDQIVVKGDHYQIYFKNRTDERVEFDHLSSGEKDILAMIFPFIEKQVEKAFFEVKGEEPPHEDLVFLIDSPEAYLHPELQRRLLKYARNSTRNEKDDLQFLVATHSTTIINEAEPEELYVLLFPDQVTDNQLVKISDEEEKLHVIRDILGATGLAVLGTGKPTLILEGKSDVEVLELLKPEIKEIFVLRDLGGKGKVLGFINALENVIPELLSKGFKIYAILDRDRSHLIKNERGIVFVWTVPCIENFLLSDYDSIYRALEVAVGKKKLSSLNIKSADDTRKLIAELIKEPDVIDYLVKYDERIHFSYEEIQGLNDKELKEKILQICLVKKARLEKKRGEIEKIVDDVDKALKELNGKVVLRRLAKKIGTRSECLARSIADKMREADNPPVEVTELLQRIKTLNKKEK
jgi:predicted ATPase